jgi:hypothetical protein
MCDYKKKKYVKGAMNYVRAGGTIPNNVSSAFPNAGQPGICPKCGGPRAMKPGWAQTERSMCEYCFRGYIENNVGDPSCFVCGQHLPYYMVEAQGKNPRGINLHIHDGPCTHIWTIIHNMAIGNPKINKKIALPYNPRPAISFDDVTDAEYVNVTQVQQKPSMIRRLIPETHKGKPVRIK